MRKRFLALLFGLAALTAAACGTEGTASPSIDPGLQSPLTPIESPSDALESPSDMLESPASS